MEQLFALIVAFILLVISWFGSLVPPPEPAAKVDVTNWQAVMNYHDWTVIDQTPNTELTGQSAYCSSTFLSPSGKGYSKPIGVGTWGGYGLDFNGNRESYWAEPGLFLGNGTIMKSPVGVADFCSVAKDTEDLTLIYTSGYLYMDGYAPGINVYSGVKSSYGGPLTKSGLVNGKTVQIIPDSRPSVVGESSTWHAGPVGYQSDAVVCYFVVGRTLEVSFTDDGNTSDQFFRISFTDWKNPSLGGTITRI